MPPSLQNTPVVLLLDKSEKDLDRIDDWLAESRYSTSEAADVFQVLEQLSDFTVRERPDLVFVHVDSLVGAQSALHTLTKSGVGEPAVAIIPFATEAAGAGGSPSFARLAAQLDRFIPQRYKAAERNV